MEAIAQRKSPLAHNRLGRGKSPAFSGYLWLLALWLVGGLSLGAGCHRRENTARAGTACSVAPGHHVHTLKVQGAARTYHVVVGARAEAQAPVVLVWHGYGGSPERLLKQLGLSAQWPEAIFVAPQGLPRSFPEFGFHAQRPGWQIQLDELNNRDLHFFDALLPDLTRRYCVARQRVYSTGFSNGGFISNFLACQRSSELRAIAPVGGGGPFEPRCGEAVPVLLTHGTADKVVPVRFALESWKAWGEHNRCSQRSPVTSGCGDAGGCAAALRLCLFHGGHRWPAEATGRVMAFFKAH